MPMSLKAARITMANYEKGASFPDVPIIKKIEKVYGLPYSEINFSPPKKGEEKEEAK